MKEKDKKLIERNMETINKIINIMLHKFAVPYDEYEDYSQTAYLVLCSRVDKYNGTTQFATFANIVIRNAIIDKLRGERAHNHDRVSLDDVVGTNNEGKDVSLDEFLAADNDTENEALAQVTKELICNCIKTAKNNCKANTTVKGFEALELKVAGYTGAEIAKLYDVPANSLRMWMSRARQILIQEYNISELV